MVQSVLSRFLKLLLGSTCLRETLQGTEEFHKNSRRPLQNLIQVYPARFRFLSRRAEHGPLRGDGTEPCGRWR